MPGGLGHGADLKVNESDPERGTTYAKRSTQGRGSSGTATPGYRFHLLRHCPCGAQNRTSTVCEPRRCNESETEFVLKKFGVTPPPDVHRREPQDPDVDYRDAGHPGPPACAAHGRSCADQQIDTLSITSADNELEGIITVKDLATANMDVFDTAVPAKSRTSL